MSKIPVLRYNRDRRRVSVDCSGPTRTKQSFADECDINIIVQHWLKTGHVSHVNARMQPLYADVSELPASYQDAMNLVHDATKSFQSLPAAVRARYQNNPELFLTALNHPEEVQFLLAEGILEQRFDPEPSPAKPNAKGSETPKPKANPDEGSPE